jgi:hypothetical protein
LAVSIAEIQRPAEKAAHDDLHGDDASDIVDIVSMTRKGRNMERWRGHNADSLDWCSACHRRSVFPSPQLLMHS